MPESPAVNPLSGLGLDRAEEHRHDLDWLRERWRHALVTVLDAEGQALSDADGAPAPVAAATLDDGDFARASLLGVDAGGAHFALELDTARAASLAPGLGWVGLRRAAASWPAQDAARFAYARGLLAWQQRARYCGRCGSPTRFGRAGHVARCTATACGLDQFPRLDPAIIVLVEHEGRCLLGRQSSWAPRLWSTLAGFVEPGESLEDAVRREIREESGVRVGACRYHSSQPWPFPSALMLGFTAEAVDPTIRLGDELEDVRWFAPDELLDDVSAGELRLPAGISISRRLVTDWLRARCGAEALARALADASD